MTILRPTTSERSRVCPHRDGDGVDWSRYARGYDLVTRLNPAYQDILERVRALAGRWALADGDTVVELGAGTGNVSTLIAALFPHCSVIHADASAAMNALAAEKASRLGLSNLQVAETDASTLSFPDGSIAVVVCIHSLYTFANPTQTIALAAHWLKPGGVFLACDFGRPMNVADWRQYMLRQLIAQLGFWRALKTFLTGRVVAAQNRRIAAEQRSGRYWLHDLNAFQNVFAAEGLAVEEATVCFRGYSDFVVCRKPVCERMADNVQANAPMLGSAADD